MQEEIFSKIKVPTFGKWRRVEVTFTQRGSVVGSITVYVKNKRVVSLPHLSYTDFRCSKDMKEQCLKRLSCHAQWSDETTIDLCNIDENARINKVEIRDIETFSPYSKTDKVTSFMSLVKDNQQQLSMLSSNIRRKINKSFNYPFQVEKGIECLDDFYIVYSHNLHRLGSPCLSKRFFVDFIRLNPDDCEVVCVYYEQVPIGAAFIVDYGRFMEPCWIATSSKYHKMNISYFLWWTCIEMAIQKHKTFFSFGRSTKESGSYQYKKSWGAKHLDLVWNYSFKPVVDIRHLGFINMIWKLLPYKLHLRLGNFVAERIY